MKARAILFLVVAIAATTAVARPSPSDSNACWQLVYRAIAHSAGAPHPKFVTYSLYRNITRDGARYDQSNAQIVYRDDGIEYVDDDRWVHPFLSGVIEPGAPVLGPFDAARASWLSQEDELNAAPLPVIANTHNRRYTCVDTGEVAINGGRAAHVEMQDMPSDVPGIRAIWIDRSNLAIRRLVVTKPLDFVVNGRPQQTFIDYAIDLDDVGGYTVVRHVAWHQVYVFGNEKTALHAEYALSNFRFTETSPVGNVFAQLRP